MRNLEPYLDKFSESGKRVLQTAFGESRRRDQHFVSPAHILYALMSEETDLFNAAMRELSISAQDVRLAVEKRLENSRRHIGDGFRIAPETTEIFKYSMDRARSENRRVIEPADILYTFATNRFDLLNDILQNPVGNINQSNASPTNIAGDQSYFLSQLKIKQSKFLTEFSLQTLLENNTSPSGLLCESWGGGGGGALSGGNSEQTTHIKHEFAACHIKSENSSKFNAEEFISSLKNDVENGLNKSGMNITGAYSSSPASFRFEYENQEMTGQVEISGELKRGYYELKAMATEKSRRETK